MVLRYIHQNPIKAGLCKNLESYPISPKRNQSVDVELALSMIGKDEFVRYHHLENNDHCLELEENNFKLTDKEAQKIIF